MTKKLVLLLGALALFGCGEKNESGASAVEAADSSADSQAAGNQPEAPFGDIAEQAPTESLGKDPSPRLLSDADVKRLSKEGVIWGKKGELYTLKV